MANAPNTLYNLTRVMPKVTGLTGISNVGAEVEVPLTPGIPGYMYHDDAATAAAAENVEIMAGNSKLNLWVLAAITAVAAGAAVDSDTGTLTFAGGPSIADATVTVTAAVDGGSDIVVTYDVTKDDSVESVVAGVQAAVAAEADLTATTSGRVVSVSPATGDFITKLQVAVA